MCDDLKLQTFYRLNKRINLVRVRTTLRESSLRVRTSTRVVSRGIVATSAACIITLLSELPHPIFDIIV